MESACANADAVDNPEVNVPKAVLGGTLLAAACYIVSTNIMFGIVPASELLKSTAPFGMVFAHMFGGTVGHIIMGLMVLSLAGSLPSPTYSKPVLMKATSLHSCRRLHPKAHRSWVWLQLPASSLSLAS